MKSLIKDAAWFPSMRWVVVIGGLTAAMLFFVPGLWMSRYNANGFMPHMHCWLRDPGVTWLHVTSDVLIGLAYLAISITLGYIVYRARRDIPFHWMFAAFGLFIVTCGFTHFMAVLNVWHALYWLEGDVKAITAVASVATALVLPVTVPRIFSLIHDAKVSEQRKRDLEAAHERLKEHEELKSRFFANVSHELRTPLSLILGPVRRRLADDSLNPTAREDLEVVERNAGLLLQQVNNLLDLSRLEAGRMSTDYVRSDLAELVRVVGSYFEFLANERRITYEIETPESVPAELDPDKIQRVLLNLLSNAFKFTPQGGQIHCALQVDRSEAVVTVEDSGSGIPEHLHEVIFERFRQIEGAANRKAGGTGLGLPIVKQFIELHGGRIHLKTAAIGGAGFSIQLPLSAPQGTQVADAATGLDHERGRQTVDELRSAPPQPPAVQTAATPADETCPLILIVEDNPDMNQFIADTLRPQFRVAAAFDGQQGLDQARRLHPDLIVTDIMMPNTSGEQMIEALQNDPTLREVPVIVLTASANEQERIGLLKKGADDHLTKPFEAAELLARIEGQIERRRESLRKLRESHDLMRAVIEGADDPVVVKDRDGYYRMANRAAAEFLGTTPERMEGARDRDLFPSDTAAEIELMDRTILIDERNRTFEENLERADGECRTLLTTKGIYRGAEGRPQGTFGLARDITDRRRTEEALKELNATLERRVSERTAQVEHQAEQLRRMTGEVASAEQRERRRLAQALHDGLQQMLVAARMNIEQAQKRTPQGSETSQALKDAEQILEDSVQASRSLTLELYPPVLYDRGLVAAMDWLARHFHQSHGLLVTAKLDPAAEPHDPDVQAFLFQAGRELLMNVVKHARADQAWVHMALDQGMLTMTVEDNGIGYEPEQAVAPDASPGGFGLFSLRERLRLLGGELHVQSSPGHGARVSLTLPQSSNQSTGEGNASSVGSGEPADESLQTSDKNRPIRVMLVDDHRIMREGLAGLLRDEDDLKIVAGAGDGREAIEQIDQKAPDVVVMDVSMPRMDGVEATQWITRERPQVRVIGLSMHNQDDLANAMLEAGAMSYLTKGGPSADLINAIRRAAADGS